MTSTILPGATVFQGGCLCGAVRYRVTGLPTKVNICHCGQCQRQTGAPFAAFAAYPLDRFDLLSGQPAGYRASDLAVREFCAACGSTLFWRADDGVVLDIFLGGFDNPAAFPPPDYALWTRHRLPWLPPLPGVHHYPETRLSQK
ncbi:MAG TPA: GFA family protein [Stellaceae bacterium]|nr:GFA family protein [Stellaceae bacterium]